MEPSSFDMGENGSSVLKFNNNQVQQAVDSFPIFGGNLLYIGSESFEYFTSFPAVHFHGLVDEVRIYNRVLSASEVLSLYNLEKAKEVLTDANFQDAVNLWFSDELNATMTYGHISDWNVSAVTDMSFAFSGKGNFNEVISAWDVSNVTNMSSMFNGSGFNQPIEGWDVSSVTNMSSMFYTSSFNQPIGDWNVSSVTNMSGMFSVAWNFNQKLEDWNVSTDTDLSYMFDWEGEGLENPIPGEIKGSLHETFSNNPTWTHDWKEFVPPNLEKGLFAWYPFDGNLSDQSGNNRELNASQLVFGTDRFGSANMALDIQEYGAFSRIEDLQTDGLVNGYSIVSWLQFDGARDQQQWFYLFSQGWEGHGETPVFRAQVQSGQLWFMTSSNWYNESIKYTLPIEQWIHLAFTNDNSSGSLYIDGQLFQSKTGENIPSSASNLPFNIGGSDVGYTWHGKIDEVRIYKRALSADEVRSIYSLESSNHVVDLNSTVSLEMIWVEPGTFTMGSPESEVGRG